mmetsp:Transcript_74392/g.123971  ORF Transcript_74392/g.123971 Transcript_74392/m.123971 type:complete len:87 (+) Transcript_74392:86-346(+)
MQTAKPSLLQHHELPPRNQRLQALREQVHAIVGHEWDVPAVPRQHRCLELLCCAANRDPLASQELCAQAVSWDMRRQGLSLRRFHY